MFDRVMMEHLALTLRLHDIKVIDINQIFMPVHVLLPLQNKIIVSEPEYNENRISQLAINNYVADIYAIPNSSLYRLAENIRMDVLAKGSDDHMKLVFTVFKNGSLVDLVKKSREPELGNINLLIEK